jgi:hypothetical protein
MLQAVPASVVHPSIENVSVHMLEKRNAAPQSQELGLTVKDAQAGKGGVETTGSSAMSHVLGHPARAPRAAKATSSPTAILVTVLTPTILPAASASSAPETM